MNCIAIKILRNLYWPVARGGGGSDVRIWATRYSVRMVPPLEGILPIFGAAWIWLHGTELLSCRSEFVNVRMVCRCV